MSEYRRYNLTLTVVDPLERDRFRMLSRPESFFEIRPNRQPGQRGAYSVEMTQDEYEAALEDAANPESNLIAVEPARGGRFLADENTVPDYNTLAFVAATDADSLGLTGAGVSVGILDGGFAYAGVKSSEPPDPSNMLEDIFAGRVKAAKGFGMAGPISDRKPVDPYTETGASGHAVMMSGLAVPPRSNIVAASTSVDFADSEVAAAFYWMADEIGVHIISISLGMHDSTVLRDAVANARAKGVIIMASAGNSGTVNDGGPGQQVIEYPGNYPGANAIANYNIISNKPAFTSNYGSKIWAATGGGPLNVYDSSLTTPYGRITKALDDGGTSAAAAIAARLAACLMTGGGSPGNTVRYLADNARQTDAGPLYEGNGVLQLEAAEQALQQDKPEKVDLDGNPLVGPDGSTRDGTGNPDPGACGK